MGAEVDAICNTEYGKRSADRTNSRNGCRARRWDKRAGTIDVQVPKLRSGNYFRTASLSLADAPSRRSSRSSPTATSYDLHKRFDGVERITAVREAAVELLYVQSGSATVAQLCDGGDLWQETCGSSSRTSTAGHWRYSKQLLRLESMSTD